MSRKAHFSLMVLRGLLLASGGGTPICAPTSPVDVWFAVVGDVQFKEESQEFAAVQAVVAKINSINRIRPLQGVVLVGDLTDGKTIIQGGGYERCGIVDSRPPWGDSGEFKAFKKLFEHDNEESAYRVKPKVYVGVGNHDLYYGGDEIDDACARRNVWKYVKGRHHGPDAPVPVDDYDELSHSYSWNWGNLHLVQLHTGGGDTGLPDRPGMYHSDLPWLARDLDGIPAETPVILFQHYNWGSGQRQPDYYWGEASARALNDVLVESKTNVIAAFHGHLHGGRTSHYHSGLLYGDGEKDVPIFNIGMGNYCSDCPEGKRLPKFALVHVTDTDINVWFYSLCFPGPECPNWPAGPWSVETERVRFNER